MRRHSKLGFLAAVFAVSLVPRVGLADTVQPAGPIAALRLNDSASDDLASFRGFISVGGNADRRAILARSTQNTSTDFALCRQS